MVPTHWLLRCARDLLRPWHMRFTYWDWSIRHLMAMTLDGVTPIVPGDGKWVLHAPWGALRGWMRGAIRAVVEPWLLRHFAFRDMAQFSEVHGMPIRVGETPATGDPEMRAQFERDLSGLGQGTTILLGKGVDEQFSYGFRLEEAKDTAWEVFTALIDRCDVDIVLALLFQNLTTDVKGGSHAAASSHMDIRESGIQGDEIAWRRTVYQQIARPFAYFNFGDANLAPTTSWDVVSKAIYAENAKQFEAFGRAIEVLRRGGIEFKDDAALQEFARTKFNLDGLPSFKFTEPVGGGSTFGNQ